MNRPYKLVGSIVILLGVVFCSCNSEDQRHDYNSNSGEILTLLIEDILNDSNFLPFYLSPILDTNLQDGEISSMRNMLELDDGDISTMEMHHNTYGNTNLKEYVGENFDNKLLYEKPGKGAYYYVLDPPLFDANFTKCIIYTSRIEIELNDYSVDYLFYEFEKAKKWELSRMFMRK